MEENHGFSACGTAIPEPQRENIYIALLLYTILK
jgi:hypothetical protein